MKSRNLIPIISYGNYSVCFINYLKQYCKNKDVALYLNILKKKWESRSKSLLDEIELAEKTCKNVGIRYLLLDLKLDITKSLKLTDKNKRLYFKLKKEFKKIRPEYRTIIGKGLMSNKVYVNKKSYKEFRTWSEIYIEDDLDKAVTYHTNALKQLNVSSEKRDFERALKLFQQSFENALKHPHPTFILASLNNASWYLRNKFPQKIETITEKLAYYCGYYLEDINVMMDYFDMITSFYRMKGKRIFFHYSELFIFYFYQYKKQNKSLEKKFKGNIDYFRKYSFVSGFFNGKKTEVKNSKGLRTFLKEKIKIPHQFACNHSISKSAVYAILNGENANIRIKTLKKIIQGLQLQLDFKNPKIINHIILKSSEREIFEENWVKIKKWSTYQLKKFVLRNFMALSDYHLIDISKLLKKCSGDRVKLYHYITLNPHLIFLFNLSQTKVAFYKARMDLMTNLFKDIETTESDKKYKEFKISKYMNRLFKIYASVETKKEAEWLNIFFRNYQRYKTTNWNLNVDEILSERDSDPDYLKIQRICHQLNLNPLFGYLSYWYFDEKRKDLLAPLSPFFEFSHI